MQIKENIKALRHWPLCGEFTGTGEFPAQRASYAENVSIWWRHHVWNIFCHLKPKFLDQEVTTSWLRSLLNKIFIYACMWHECPLSPQGVQLFLNYWLVCLLNQFKFRDKHCELLYRITYHWNPEDLIMHLCCHWWCWRLSLWHFLMTPLMTKLAWLRLRFSMMYVSEATFWCLIVGTLGNLPIWVSFWAICMIK